MTGSPTSVSPGLAPTALTWGYPHVEVFALTKNTTSSVYRKFRNINATSEYDFMPQGRDMVVVGGHVDTKVAPSISLIGYIYTDATSGTQNATQIQIYDKDIQSGHYKFHDHVQVWTPWGGTSKDKLFNPDIWEGLPTDTYLSAPTAVQYEKTQDMIKVFYIGHDSTGSTVHYLRYTSTSNWAGPFRIYGPDLHEWAPAVIAWAGNDSRLDVFAVSRVNNHLVHTFKEADADQWTEYEDLKGFVTVPPTVVSRQPGRLDVFVRGGDARLWHLSFGDGKWSNWQCISGKTRIQGQPHAISTGPGSIDVFAWGEARGESLYKTYDAVTQKWSPDGNGFTTLIPGGLIGPPKSMVYGNDVEVFAYNIHNQIMWQTIGPDKKAKGDAKAWADVPYNVA
ncbi:hypothetical protein PG993_008442 [Apiospora rasikravindrae]|uniref:PLL-like beta propeller domain-containing protein n=1 Tax=Apiospora rasikravindrae TaxID=990691 RepID=A0ABR1T0C6_9PEZI